MSKDNYPSPTLDRPLSLFQLRPLKPYPSNNFNFLPSTAPFRSNVLQVYKIFHNLCYHLFLIPYKIQSLSPSSPITLRESRARDVICYTLHFLRLLYQIPLIILTPISKKISSGRQFYDILNGLTYFVFVATFSLFCVRKSLTISLIQKLASLHNQQGRWRRSRTRRWSLGLCYGIIFISIFFAVAFFIIDNWGRLNCVSFQDFMNSWTDAASKHFQLAKVEDNWNENMTTLGLDGVHVSGKVVIACSYLFLRAFSYLTSYLTALMVFMECLVVYELGMDFMAIFEDPDEDTNAVAVMELGVCKKKMSLEEVKGCYEELWVVLDTMNKAFGKVVLSFILTTVPRFALHIVNISSVGTNWFNTVVPLYTFMLYGTSLSLAAEGHHQRLTGLIYKERRSLGGVGVEDGNEMLTFLVHVKDSVGKCGVRGGQFFTISYDFVASALLMVLTHTIIMLQFTTTTEKI